jgi:hypothetical protein
MLNADLPLPVAAHIEWFCIVWHTGPLSDTFLRLIPADPQWIPVRVARVADLADLTALIRRGRHGRTYQTTSRS